MTDNKCIKVSVIIPTYKRSADVGKAIQSACNQSLKEIEIIVVDDNNPDSNERKETRDVVKTLMNYDSRIIYIEHEKNMNGSVARNSGIKRASGKYIAFLDDDDVYLPKKLELQYFKMEELPENYGGCIVDCSVERNGTAVKTLIVDEQKNALKEVLACTYNIGSGSNLFIKSSIVKEIDGFDEHLLRHQDYDFLARFFLKYDIYKISTPLFSIEQRSSHLNTPNLEKSVVAKKFYLDKYKSVIENFSREDCCYIYYNNYMSLCETAIRGKQFGKAKKYLKKAKMYKQISIKQMVRIILLSGYSIVPVSIRRHLLVGK